MLAGFKGVQRAVAGNNARRLFHSSTPTSAKLYDSVLDIIGDTPLIKLNRLAPEGVNVYGKLESVNPLSSVKDRLALAVVTAAEDSGALQPGGTVVEATSGNTGIALAMVCAAKGYNCIITMAEPFSVERRKIMRMLGAKVIVTPAAEKGTGMVKKAKELAEAHGYVWTRQFENEANAAYHAKTTGPEILEAFNTKSLDYFVLGYGTGGTLSGAGRTIKAASPNTQIIVSEPSNAALLTSGDAQARQEDGSTAATHSAFNPHPIQGWTPDFIPLITEEAASIYDKVITVEPPVAIKTAQDLASKEGLFVGISAGASVASALEVAQSAPAGSNIVTMLPDTAERYLSTPLFENIGADMNEEELEISKSTPNYQL